MDTAHPLYVVFVWHMHQPYYRDAQTGDCLLPWVRLHGLKDYYDIPAISTAYPEIHQTFNLVPSLIIQLEEYTVQGKGDLFFDVALRPADSLTMADRLFLLRNFFLANTETMITPYPRYRQLLDQRGRYGSLEELSQVQERFRPQDFLDLQVWFHLTWTGQTLRGRPEVQRLFKKGQNFTEEEKHDLLQLQREFLAEIIPFYSQLQETGQIEISLSPFYHPILPLLCDSHTARVALPRLPLPSRRFVHPEDARAQVRRGVECYQDRFGRPPRGMWPSEGSVSPEIIPIVADAGLRWLATDDEILAYSLASSAAPHDPIPALSPAQRYRPYRVTDGDRAISILFRDHLLSDRIGFVYSRWNAADAAADFVGRLLEIRRQLPPTRPFVVPIILDGENAWEYYPHHGRDFLQALYTTLSRTPELQAVTVSEALEAVGEPAPLERLFSGSWIGHNFATWIGHAEKNTGWECLEDARHAVADYERRAASLEEHRCLQEAWESMLIAEGSDWFWWYGDDHSSMNDEEFDTLFRTHVANVYRALGVRVPDHLARSIRQPRIVQPVRVPISPISPVLDGRATSYYEWLAAGYYDVRGGHGSMHQADTFLKRVHYGFDAERLYLRIDTAAPLTEELFRDVRVQVQFSRPAWHQLVLVRLADGRWTLATEGNESVPSGAVCAVGRVVELAIPILELHARPCDAIELAFTVHQGEQALEHWPRQGVIRFIVPDPDEEPAWFV